MEQDCLWLDMCVSFGLSEDMTDQCYTALTLGYRLIVLSKDGLTVYGGMCLGTVSTSCHFIKGMENTGISAL